MLARQVHQIYIRRFAYYWLPSGDSTACREITICGSDVVLNTTVADEQQHGDRQNSNFHFLPLN